jgi:hypothetical protein
MRGFTKATLCSMTLAAFLAGCGSNAEQQQSSGGATGSANRPHEDFQTPPENFEQAQTKAGRTSGADGYDYVHAHLKPSYHGPEGEFIDCTGTWADSSKGMCKGSFLGGSSPFDNVRGETRWERFGSGGNDAVPGPAKSIPAVGDAGIKITQATDSGKSIECFIQDRSRGDCYTDHEQQGKPTGQPGGPLSLNASFPSHGDSYVLLRGFCRRGDELCTPH